MVKLSRLFILLDIDNLLRKFWRQFTVSYSQLEPNIFEIKAYPMKITVALRNRIREFWMKINNKGTPGPKNINYSIGL